jgi:Tol biopolymer transport system component
LCIGALDSQEVKTLGPASFSDLSYSSGYLLYMLGNTLMAQPFDEKRLATTREAVPVIEQVRSIYSGFSPRGVFSVSREGLLVYQAGFAAGHQLTWFDRTGKPMGTLGDPGDFWSVDFSPDRKRVAVTLLGPNTDIWIYDVARGLPTRFTTSPASERNPVWSRDGRSIIYYSDAKGNLDLYRKAADGTGDEELLYADGTSKIPTSLSPDGKFLLYWRLDDLQKGQEIWAIPVATSSGTNGTSKPFPWLATGFSELMAKFSPDGHWLAYQSNRSGRFEIYVSPFPGPSGKRKQISNAGGLYPRWRADGKEIFYELNGTLMAAEVSIKGGDVEVGAVRSLSIPVTSPYYLYDASLDGKQFLVAAPLEQKSPAQLTLVQNWTALLKKK